MAKMAKVSASASVLSMNIQNQFPLGWTGWVSFLSKGLSRDFFNNAVQSINSLVLRFLYSQTLTCIHDYWKKNIFLTRQTVFGKVMSPLFNILSGLVIAFLWRSKHLLISWLQSQPEVILELKNKVSHCFHCFPIYLPWSDGTGCHDLTFLNVEL